jgi:hypothetical protein
MTRIVTLKELVLEELNRQLAEEGRDVRVFDERPRPQLATRDGNNVVRLNATEKGNVK